MRRACRSSGLAGETARLFVEEEIRWRASAMKVSAPSRGPLAKDGTVSRVPRGWHDVLNPPFLPSPSFSPPTWVYPLTPTCAHEHEAARRPPLFPRRGFRGLSSLKSVPLATLAIVPLNDSCPRPRDQLYHQCVSPVQRYAK